MKLILLKFIVILLTTQIITADSDNNITTVTASNTVQDLGTSPGLIPQFQEYVRADSGYTCLIILKPVLENMTPVEQKLWYDAFIASKNSVTGPSNMKSCFDIATFKKGLKTIIDANTASLNKELTSQSLQVRKALSCLKVTADTLKASSQTQQNIKMNIKDIIDNQTTINQCASVFLTKLLNVLNLRKRYLLLNSVDLNNIGRITNAVVDFPWTEDEMKTIVPAFIDYANCYSGLTNTYFQNIQDAYVALSNDDICKGTTTLRFLQDTSTAASVLNKLILSARTQTFVNNLISNNSSNTSLVTLLKLPSSDNQLNRKDGLFDDIISKIIDATAYFKNEVAETIKGNKCGDSWQFYLSIASGKAVVNCSSGLESSKCPQIFADVSKYKDLRVTFGCSNTVRYGILYAYETKSDLKFWDILGLTGDKYTIDLSSLGDNTLNLSEKTKEFINTLISNNQINNNVRFITALKMPGNLQIQLTRKDDLINDIFTKFTDSVEALKVEINETIKGNKCLDSWQYELSMQNGSAVVNCSGNLEMAKCPKKFTDAAKYKELNIIIGCSNYIRYGVLYANEAQTGSKYWSIYGTEGSSNGALDLTPLTNSVNFNLSSKIVKFINKLISNDQLNTNDRLIIALKKPGNKIMLTRKDSLINEIIPKFTDPTSAFKTEVDETIKGNKCGDSWQYDLSIQNGSVVVNCSRGLERAKCPQALTDVSKYKELNIIFGCINEVRYGVLYANETQTDLKYWGIYGVAQEVPNQTVDSLLTFNSLNLFSGTKDFINKLISNPQVNTNSRLISALKAPGNLKLPLKRRESYISDLIAQMTDATSYFKTEVTETIKRNRGGDTWQYDFSIQNGSYFVHCSRNLESSKCPKVFADIAKYKELNIIFGCVDKIRYGVLYAHEADSDLYYWDIFGTGEPYVNVPVTPTESFSSLILPPKTQEFINKLLSNESVSQDSKLLSLLKMPSSGDIELKRKVNLINQILSKTNSDDATNHFKTEVAETIKGSVCLDSWQCSISVFYNTVTVICSSNLESAKKPNKDNLFSNLSKFKDLNIIIGCVNKTRYGVVYVHKTESDMRFWDILGANEDKVDAKKTSQCAKAIATYSLENKVKVDQCLPNLKANCLDTFNNACKATGLYDALNILAPSETGESIPNECKINSGDSMVPCLAWINQNILKNSLTVDYDSLYNLQATVSVYAKQLRILLEATADSINVKKEDPLANHQEVQLENPSYIISDDAVVVDGSSSTTTAPVSVLTNEITNAESTSTYYSVSITLLMLLTILF
jgi:hypothetical protein